jgi:uncharacterized protein YgfB (UPF0149 family)
VADLDYLAGLADAVVGSGGAVSPAVLHGAVCGLAVFDAPEFPLARLADLLAADARTADAALARFVDAAVDQLHAEDLGFAVLLPDDAGIDVEQRVTALGEWCASFLQAFGTGLGIAAETDLLGPGDFSLPEELQEIIDDFAAIAGVDSASITELEDGEAAAELQLMELNEYVKVGVLLILSGLVHGAGADQDG